ncbi:Ribosomal protein S7 [Ascosphaera apis ARSEF 7405]|uniref:Small ribosomal subunit protein uS7m n=1 Tax=Ascosphaera apis ARSEF 7405 TaxID=392613 RepID=A0A162JFV9_9EURO|nr:Ribosomal protein S7 [Ascosphaera apis ARSEF 7405]
MPPRITLNINRLASSRLVARGSAQSFTAVNTDAATTGAGIDITRRFSALCVRDTTNCNAINSSALRRSCPQHQQRRMQSTSDGKSDDPAVRKIEEDVEKTPEDKLAGHNIPHPKLKKSLSPEEEQGSPVEEFFKRDKNALKYAPKVVQDKLNPKPPAGSRSYSTAVDSAAGGNGIDAPLPGATPMEQLIAVMENKPEAPIEGLKFDMPPKPDYATGHFRKRYDPVLDQFTKMLMRDGKLARAENTMNAIIDILRRSPPPKVVPERPLVYSLPAEEYPLNPVLYLTNVVDSIAPLLRLKQMKGAAGGGMSLPVPRPLNSRQRRRTAIKWIIEASEKRRDIALPKRIADEIVAVAEGRSSVWQKRDMVHKSGISARTNMSLGPRR